jgi:hypothetical protein
MRIRHAIFTGIVAALASLTASALARNSEVKNSEVKTPSEPSGSSSCSALQKTADGTWARSPCQELGSPAATPAQIRGANSGPANAVSPSGLRPSGL